MCGAAAPTARGSAAPLGRDCGRLRVVRCLQHEWRRAVDGAEKEHGEHDEPLHASRAGGRLLGPFAANARTLPRRGPWAELPQARAPGRLFPRGLGPVGRGTAAPIDIGLQSRHRPIACVTNAMGKSNASVVVLVVARGARPLTAAVKSNVEAARSSDRRPRHGHRSFGAGGNAPRAGVAEPADCSRIAHGSLAGRARSGYCRRALYGSKLFVFSMAEREGFEPSVPGLSPVQQISNLPCSASPAPLRGYGSTTWVRDPGRVS